MRGESAERYLRKKSAIVVCVLAKKGSKLKTERGGGMRREHGRGMDGAARREFCTKKRYHNCHI